MFSYFGSRSSAKSQFLVSKRYAQKGVPRPRKIKKRFSPSKRRPPAGGLQAVLAAPEQPYMGKINSSPTRAHSPNFYGPPRKPIPRVEKTSVEFHQNLRSLCNIVQGKLGLYNLGISHFDDHSKSALKRLEDHAERITSKVPNLYLYQIVIVEDILRYSRDMGSRHTLWIPDDFEVEALVEFLKENCLPDPTLHAIRHIGEFYNPFQNYSPDRKNSINKRSFPRTANEEMWRVKDPIDLLKLRDYEQRYIYHPKLKVRFRDYKRLTYSSSIEEVERKESASEDRLQDEE